MLLVELEQRLLKFGKLKEPVLFAGSTADRTLAVRADEFAVLVLLKVGFGVVRLFVDAVPALVGTLVQPAAVVEVLPELLDRASLARLGGAHEVGVGDIEQIPCLAEDRLHGIAPCLRRHAVLFSGLGYLLAMLVHASDEGDVVAVHALIARHRVSGDGRVGRAQMRSGVHVVDRGSERIGSFAHGCPFQRSDE